MINLSSAQEKIVSYSIGQPIQVLASAGTGKTRVLTERIRFILENTRKESVIALTFTNKAAEEMQDRLDDVDDIEDKCWISTIHGVAQRILEQYGHTIGLPSDLHIYERDQDRKSVFLQSLRENGVDIDAFLNVSDERARKNRERTIQRYMDQFSIVKRMMFGEQEVKNEFSNNEKFWTIFQAYQQALLDSGGIDFDDILVYSHRILLEQPWCGDIYRAKFKHVCVDEAQDLNKAQYEFIKALCGEKIKSLMMVGDPNQMIYGFNGSSHDYLCKSFVDDFGPNVFFLVENYRSSKSVIHLANKLKPGSQIESQFALEGVGQIQEFQGEKEEAEWIGRTINELLEVGTHPEIEGDISLENMVVIARNRFAFRELESYLEVNKVPYYLKKGERQVEPASLFGKILDLSIRLRINTKDWVHGKKLCAILKVDPPEDWGREFVLDEIASKTKPADVYFPSLQASLLHSIQELNIEEPNIPKLCRVFSEKIEEMGSEVSGKSFGELEHSLQELQDFRNSWTIFKQKGLGDSLSSFRTALSLGQLVNEYNPKGLMLSSVHTMKGLEKDIVFLMGMCEGVFPDYRAESDQEIDEERNNAFVAVTRSRRWIYISYPLNRKMPWGSVKIQRLSRFVKDMKS